MVEQLEKVDFKPSVLFFYLNGRLTLALQNRGNLSRWRNLKPDIRNAFIGLVEGEFTKPFINDPHRSIGKNEYWEYEVSTFILKPLSVVGSSRMADWYYEYKHADEYLPGRGYKLIKI